MNELRSGINLAAWILGGFIAWYGITDSQYKQQQLERENQQLQQQVTEQKAEIRGLTVGCLGGAK